MSIQLVQTLRYQQQNIPIASSPGNRDIVDDPSTMVSSCSGLRSINLQQQQQVRTRQPIRNNMIGLSSVSYVKKSHAKDILPNIPTSISSPRISSSCRTPFVTRKNQLPMFIRKQQQQQLEEKEQDDEDDREIVKNNNSGLLNPYGLPTNNNRTQSQKKSELNQKIRVCVRKRPLSKKEVEKSEKDITSVKGLRTVHVNEPK